MTRVLVTRPAAQAGELVALLGARGIASLAIPTVEIEPLPGAPLPDALGALREGDWLVVSSPNGAEAVGRLLAAAPGALHASARIAAVGPATAARLAMHGLRASRVPKRFVSAAIAREMGDLAGRRVVLARADAATGELRTELERRSALVTEVVVYRTLIAPAASRAPLSAALADGIDGLAFASGSAVRGLIALLPPELLERARRLPSFCIGPVTARAAVAGRLSLAGVAPQHTAAGLAAVVAQHLGQETR